MKFLQIKKNGELLENPRILEMGVDFSMVDHGGFNRFVQLSDCYQARPLNEIINNWFEFDVFILEGETLGKNSQWIKHKTPSLFLYTNLEYIIGKENLGSIFLPKNQQKYPELYREALKTIKL